MKVHPDNALNKEQLKGKTLLVSVRAHALHTSSVPGTST